MIGAKTLADADALRRGRRGRARSSGASPRAAGGARLRHAVPRRLRSASSSARSLFRFWRLGEQSRHYFRWTTEAAAWDASEAALPRRRAAAHRDRRKPRGRGVRSLAARAPRRRASPSPLSSRSLPSIRARSISSSLAYDRAASANVGRVLPGRRGEATPAKRSERARLRARAPRLRARLRQEPRRMRSEEGNGRRRGAPRLHAAPARRARPALLRGACSPTSPATCAERPA